MSRGPSASQYYQNKRQDKRTLSRNVYDEMSLKFNDFSIFRF